MLKPLQDPLRVLGLPHGSDKHDFTVQQAIRPQYQFRSKCYEEDYELISDFELLADWGTPAGCTNDTVNFREGFQGIKFTSINGAWIAATKTMSLNCLGRHFTIWVYIDDVTHLDFIRFDFYSGVKRFWNRFAYPTTQLVSGWNFIALPRADFTMDVGAVNADWGTVTSVRMNLAGVVGTTLNVTFDDYRMIRDRFAGKVTLRFDDAFGDTYTEARARMDKYGLRGVAAVPTSLLNTSGCLTTEQCTLLQERGWDIVSHTVSHAHLATLPLDEVESELRDSQRWLVENGFYKGSRFFIVPYNEWSSSVMELIEKYYLECSTRITQQVYNTIPPNPYRITNPAGISAGTPFADIQAYLDRAKETGAWIILLFHSISAMTALFQQIINYIETIDLEVITFSDVLDNLIIDKPINRLAGIVPTFDTFDTNPSSPTNMTDENWTTESGEGVKALGAPGTVGNINFDMGAVYPVLVIAHVNAHRDSGDGTLTVRVDYSLDGITYYPHGVYSQAGLVASAYRGFNIPFLYARYFRIIVISAATSVASVYHVKVAEVQALQLL